MSKVDDVLEAGTRDKWYTKGVHNSRISRVSGLGTAKRIRDNHAVCASSIVRGTDGKFWVMPKADAEKMCKDHSMELVA